MNKETEFDRLLGLIYEAALDDEYWQAVLLALSDFFNAAGTALWVHDTDSGGVGSETGEEGIRSVRFDPVHSASYAEYYAQTNVWSKKEDLLLVEGTAVSSSTLFDDKRLNATEFYGDWLRPQDLFYSMGVLVAKSGSLAIKLSALRAQRKGPFSDAELAGAQRLFPHLKRACDMNKRLAVERSSTANQLAISHLAQQVSDLCLLGVSAIGEVLYANPFGEALLREGHGLVLKGGCLHAVNADRDSELQLALRNTAVLKRPHHLNLDGRNGRARCLYLTLIPAPESHPLHQLAHRIEVLVLVTEHSRQRVATVRQLIELFGLTPAEARFARALTQGENIDIYAKAEGLKKTTVRSQLQSALMKTGMGTQRDLVRLVLSIPAVRDA